MRRWLNFGFLILATWLFSAPAWAATQIETLNFVASTAGATTTVTTSFQGKAVILFSHGKTTEGESAGASFSIGFSNGTLDHTVSWAGDNAVATTNAGYSQWTTNVLQILTNGTPTVATGGSVTGVAFNSTTMVLTFNSTPSAAWEISAILFGGTDITNAFVGNATALTSVGNKSITGVGFQGDAVFFISQKKTGTSGQGSSPLLSFATTATKEWALYGLIDDAVSDVPDGRSRIVNDGSLSGFLSPTSVEYKADFTQWTGDGFDLNFSDAAGSLWVFGYLVLKGGQWDAGVQAKPATATAQTFNVAFTPKAIGFAMSSPVTLDLNRDNCITTVGAWDGTTEVYAGAYHNNVFNTVATSSGASTKLLHEMNTTTGADGTTLAANTVITWDAAGTAFQVAWWAAGDNAASTGTQRRAIVFE